jgi:PST family polysaccharide transporter/lipopolysaccharide exporter
VGLQGIYLVRTLALARLLFPEHFGLVAIGTTTVGLAVNVTDLGMVPALVQRRDAKLTDYNTAWTVGVLRALLVTGTIAGAAPWIAAAFGEPGATNIIRALALRPLFEALASIRTAWLTRDLRFRSLAMIRVPPALVDLGVAVALARSLGVWAMVAGTLSGASAVIVLSYVFAPHRPKPQIDRESAGSLIRFGRWIFASGLLNAASGAFIQLVISRSLGVAALGLYSLAGRLAFLPFHVASDVVGSVAFPVYSRLQTNRDEVAVAFRGFLTVMACLLLPVLAVIIGLAPDLVEYVLGSRWLGTAPIIQVLALVGALQLFGDAVNPLLKGLGHPRKIVVLGAFQTLLVLALVQFMADRFGAVGAAASWVPAVLATQVLSAYYLFQFVPNPLSQLGRPITAVLFASVAAGAFSMGLAGAFPGTAGTIMAAVFPGMMAYWILWKLDRRFSFGFAEAILRVFPRASGILR